MNVLNQVARVPGTANQPMMSVNKTANTITVRSSAAVAKIFERVIESNDKPRAELLIDVEILEVNRTRAKQYGIDLNGYSANFVFSPGSAPGSTTAGTGTTGTGTTGTGTTGTTTTNVAGATQTNLFGLNALRGFTKGDMYLAIPAAIIRLLESDSDTKLVAKPLRGSEGEKLSLNLGQQIPVPTTTFGAVGAGGINTIPISSFQLKDVGLNFTITPRVTFENDIILTLTLENSTFQGTVNLAGQNLPQFGQRHVETRLRLRDGETNLLAGLLQTDDSRSVTGFPGLVRIPIFKPLFSSNNNQYTQTDIVMLLTPHIIRSHDLTQRDVSPIYIGTPSNLGLSGPPPLISGAASGRAAAGRWPGRSGGAGRSLRSAARGCARRTADDAGARAARQSVAHAGHRRASSRPAADRGRRSAARGRRRRRRGRGATTLSDATRGSTATGRRHAGGARSIWRAGDRGRGSAGGDQRHESRFPRGRRAVHRADHDLRRQCHLDHELDRPVQSCRPEGAGCAGRRLHAPGRSRFRLHAAGGRGHRPNRHYLYAGGRHDRRGRRRPGGGNPVRSGRAGQFCARDQRRGGGTDRQRGSAAVRARGHHRPVGSLGGAMRRHDLHLHKEDGERCQARKLHGSEFCYFHSPQVIVERAEARRRGGQHRNGGKGETGSYVVKSPQDVLQVLEDALNDSCALDNTCGRAKAIGFLAQVILKGFEATSIDTRITALEEKIYGKH